MRSLIVLLILVSSSSFAKERGVITKVISGDTLKIKVLKKEVTCQLSGVISPSKSIVEGKDSLKSLESHLSQVVIFNKKGKTCQVFVAGVKDLAKLQLEWGRVWINYQTIDKALVSSYEESQAVGKIRKEGIWKKPLKVPLVSQNKKKNLGKSQKEH